MPHKLGVDGAPCYTLAFYSNVGKVEFAAEPSDSKCETPPFRGGVANPLEWKEVIELILLALFLFLLLTRTRRTKLKIEIDL
jgi:hypothetical protein